MVSGGDDEAVARPLTTVDEGVASSGAPPPVSSDACDGDAAAPGSCPGCGHPVDPLRAGHVAFLDGRFRYFCGSECKAAYRSARGQPREEDIATLRPPEVECDRLRSHLAGQPFEPAAPREDASETPPVAIAPPTAASVDPSAEQPTPLSDAADADPHADTSAGVRETEQGRSFHAAQASRGLRPILRGTLDGAGILLGALTLALGLVGERADPLRLALVVASWCALALHFAWVARDRADPHPLFTLLPASGAVGAACWARVARDPRAAAIAALAGLSCACALVIERLVERARQGALTERERMATALDLPVRIVHGDDTVERNASDARPGDHVVVDAGEAVGVDGTVVDGEARVVPWHGSPVEVLKRTGDPVVAGARVVNHRLRLVTASAGCDRAWLRLSSSPRARIDVFAPTARAVRLVVDRSTPLAAVLVGGAAFAAGARGVEVLAALCAGAIAFGGKALGSLVGLGFARAQIDALSHGITYKDARAFEHAGVVSLAVLSARGTVLAGEPELVVIETVGTLESERVLSLAAGAEVSSTHPCAAPIVRAARTRGIEPDAVRNCVVRAGLGVTAAASDGERLVVGGRAIMLEEKVGVAAADARVSELESQGRSVLLVALGGRLVGLLALQDSWMPGARAAVQQLLDARIEPVLVSGEARDTCEAMGRALDIDHVRPEVPLAQRGIAVRALAEGGAVVAVVGHPMRDDAALASADVPIAMAAAGSNPGQWAVALAGDDVSDAALALAIARAARGRARVAAVLGAVPGLLTLLAMAIGVAPLAAAPVASLLGAVAAAAFLGARGAATTSGRGRAR